MGGSLRFMFEDLNRSRGLGEPRGGSFPAHFGAVSVLIAVVLMFNFTNTLFYSCRSAFTCPARPPERRLIPK